MLYNMMKRINREMYGESNYAWKLLTNKERTGIIISFLLLIVSGIVQAVSFDAKWVVYKIGLIGLIISGIFFAVIIKKTEKNHLDEMMEDDIQRIEKLQKFLACKLQIRKKEQYKNLIDIYEGHLEEIKQRKDKRTKMLIGALSGVITIIGILFSNKAVLGDMFFYILTIIIAVVCVAVAVWVGYKFLELFDDISFEYERTIENLKCAMLLLEEN